MKRFFNIVLWLSMILINCEVYASTSLTYVYDANGNLISGDGQYYEYNDANQLVKVRQGDQGGPVIAEYVYDYAGQRIKKIENGVPTYYIGKHYETTVSGSDTINTSYYFANGERVAKKDSAGNMYYYHSDHLGGTNVVTNSSGNLVERIKYYPFGEIREGGNEKYLYTGKEKDKLTDWNYFEARYYGSDLKHFTQADTVEPDYYNPQDLNRYSYVLNSPVILGDPTGHKAENKYERYLNLSAKTSKESLSQLLEMLSKLNLHGNRLVIRKLSKSDVKALKSLKSNSRKLSMGLDIYDDAFFVYHGFTFFGSELMATATGGRLGKHHSIMETVEMAEDVPVIGLPVTTAHTMMTENRETRAGFTLGLSEAIRSSNSNDAFMNGFTLGLWGLLKGK